LKHRFTRRPIIRKNPNLDQTVGIEGGINLLSDIGGQAVISDQNHWIEVVRLRPVRLALCGSHFDLGHVGIIDRMDVPKKNSKPAGKKLNKAWLHDHLNDPYVKLATREGYRARAAYKLKEMDETLRLFKPGDVVVDLGSTPGAWSQYLRRRMLPDGAAAGQVRGAIVAVDLLPMESIEGVHFILGDFREAQTLSHIEAALGNRQVDVVVSDMAPNLTGIASVDAAGSEYLVELAIEFAQSHLVAHGVLVAKVFHGASYDTLVKCFKASFHAVKPFKPKASRDRSAETYLVGKGLR
jgi:23S rRNA (uridine2552-2'-O)-methyltransferase